MSVRHSVKAGSRVVYRLRQYSMVRIGTVQERLPTEFEGDYGGAGWLVRADHDERLYCIRDGVGTIKPATKEDERWFDSDNRAARQKKWEVFNDPWQGGDEPPTREVPDIPVEGDQVLPDAVATDMLHDMGPEDDSTDGFDIGAETAKAVRKGVRKG